MARHDTFFALLLVGCFLTLAVIFLAAVLRNHPSLGRAVVVIPVVTLLAAAGGASAELLYTRTILAAIRGAFLAGVTGLAWGVVIWAVIAATMRSPWWRRWSSLAATPERQR